MNKRHLSCLSPLAMISAFLTLALLAAAKITLGSSMFSPGVVHASHAQIGNDCGQCHAPFWSDRRLSDLCLDCHVEIQGELAEPSTMHGILFRDGFRPCQNCHTEHAGPEAYLTDMETDTFPHEMTGFALTRHYSHSGDIPFSCSDCHIQSISTFDQQTCVDCHQGLDLAFTSTHSVAFGLDCLACHDGYDRYSGFDHSQGDFTLTGAHIQAACSGCHVNARTISELQNTPAACESCHLKDDRHAGRFGTACDTCHTAEAWKPAQFDHNLAAFQLKGKHEEVACEKCHIDSQHKGTPQDCFTCHRQDDQHDNRYGTACETCHHPGGWQDATFDHSLSAFPLDGAHINVECTACHIGQSFKGTPHECGACHADPAYHLGLFPGQACSLCHSTAAWRPARYESPHTFPMNHGEQNNICADCHQPNLTQWTCYTCHERAETEREHTKEGITNFGSCLQCHPTGREDEAEGEKDDD